jgi:hypothetical protein
VTGRNDAPLSAAESAASFAALMDDVLERLPRDAARDRLARLRAAGEEDDDGTPSLFARTP